MSTQPVPGECATATASERRAAKRFDSIRQASCSSLAEPRAPHFVRVQNVSANGIGLLSPHYFERGTMLLIQVEDSGQACPPVLVGKVVHVSAQANGQWLVGCALTRALAQADVRALAEEDAGVG